MPIKFEDVLRRIESETGWPTYKIAESIDVQPHDYLKLKTGTAQPTHRLVMATKKLTDRLIAGRRN